MKCRRISVALFIYECLLAGQTVRGSEVRDELDVSISTFRRAISDVRCFLMERHPDRELIYEKLHDAYRFVTVTL